MRDTTAAAFSAAYDAMLARFSMKPEARDVATPGATTRVHVWGRPDAPPLLLMHGFKVTSTMWAPNAAALGAVRRVYAPDTLGDYGFSRAERPPRSLDDLMIWLEALLDALGLAATDLGGMSYGGWLAAHFAARRPERVRRLVMIAPGGAFGGFSPAWYLRGLPMLVWKRRQFVDAYLRWAGVPGGGELYEACMEGLIDVMLAGHRQFPVFGLPIPGTISPAVLQKIRAPALLVYGAREKMHAAGRACAAARRHLPTLECVIVPDASHDLTFRQAERVNAAVTAFLTRT
jgi:pimeloyl-ACP methyl ester carboxylesterase